MIGRLGIPTSITGNSGSQPKATTTRGSITSAGGSMMNNIGTSSMASLSGLSNGLSKIGTMTKKVTETLTLSNENDRKNQLMDEKKAQIAQVVSMLEDISLQSPSTHLGLVLAYTGRTCSPVIHPGLKFTWFRMRGEDQVDQVEESSKAWYAPSVDDIGCTICVQCEDSYGQGLSRYLECGPLLTDPLLRSAGESAIDFGSFETKGVCVSLGLAENDDLNSVIAPSMGDTPGTLSTQNSASNDASTLHTVLSKDNAFLQLNGKCTVEVDDQGVFISIPTFQPQHSSSNHHAKAQQRSRDGISAGTNGGAVKTAFNTSRRGLRLPALATMKVHCVGPNSLVLAVPLMRKAIEEGPISAPATFSSDAALSTQSSPAKQAVPSLREPGSTESTEANSPQSNGATVASTTTAAGQEQDDEVMKRFLQSSILAIPWTYEGHNLSPEAYITGIESRLSPEEREKLLKEAEEDAMIFATTVVALAEFIAAVPEGSDELLICFSATDRLTRDTLAVSLRALACRPPQSTRYERMRTLPWVIAEEDNDQTLNAEHDHNHSNNNNVVDHDLKRRLKSMEEESAALKRERNELTMQLLQTKEEMLLMKSKFSKASSHNSHNNPSSSGNNAISPGGIISGVAMDSSSHSQQGPKAVSSSDDLEGLQHASSTGSPLPLPSPVVSVRAPSNGDVDVGAGVVLEGVEGVARAISSDKDADTHIDHHHMNSRALQQKLIEVENKLAIATRREQDSQRQRHELESQNTRLSQELEATKHKKDEAKEKLQTLQRLYDQQTGFMHKLEEENSKWRTEADRVVGLEKDVQLQKQLVAQRDERIRSLQQELETAQTDVRNFQAGAAYHETQLAQLRTAHEVQVQTLTSSIHHLEQQIASSVLENKRLERHVMQLDDKIAQQTTELQRITSLETSLQEAQRKNDTLNAEMNHLQKKSESQARDLKRILKDNAQSLSEFEKALIRKSGECDELYYQLTELRELEKARQQAYNGDEGTGGSAILSRLSSIVASSGVLTSAGGSFSLNNSSNINNPSSHHSSTSSKDGIDNSSNNNTINSNSSPGSNTNTEGTPPTTRARSMSGVSTMFRRMSGAAATFASTAGISGTGNTSTTNDNA